MPLPLSGSPLSGGRRHGASVKTLKRLLKKAGLKTSGRKAALTRRAKKARLMGGQVSKAVEAATEGVKAVANIPGDVAKAALDGKGRRRRY